MPDLGNLHLCLFPLEDASAATTELLVKSVFSLNQT